MDDLNCLLPSLNFSVCFQKCYFGVNQRVPPSLFTYFLTMILTTSVDMHYAPSMTLDTYKESLKQAKLDLARAVTDLGDAEERVERETKKIVELRQTVTVLSRLCGEPEYVEEDALGLTDVIRLAYRSAVGGTDLTLQDVKDRIDSMGYAGRWGNLLASVHTVTKRLIVKNDVELVGNVNGKDTYRWVGKSGSPVPDEARIKFKLALDRMKQKGRLTAPEPPRSRFNKI
jgi:hypothetical protein